MNLKKPALCLLMTLYFTGSFSQNLNHFKHVIIPKKFDFLKQDNQYQLNELTKFLLEKEGFTVFFDDEQLPKALANNRCKALYADVLNQSKMLKTKLQVVLKDCQNKPVFTSEMGASKIKEFRQAYQQALREAFNSFKTVSYQYQPLETKPEGAPNNLKTISESTETKPNLANNVIETKASVSNTLKSNALQAKWFGLGFEVFDAENTLVMVLLTSAQKDVYIVKGKDALVSQNASGEWIYSENSGKDLMTKVLDIKF
jgi:hypothetical protein